MDSDGLLERARNGDGKAQRAIFEMHVDMVYAIVSAYERSADDSARDLVQRVFMKVFQGLDSLEAEDSMAPWIRRICHNTGIDHIRERQKERRLASEYLIVMDARSDTPEEIFSAEEMKAAVAETIAEEKDGQCRETVALFYDSGLTIKQISEELGVAETTVTSRLARFRGRLRKKLVIYAMEIE